jgi:hypothetical protein
MFTKLPPPTPSSAGCSSKLRRRFFRSSKLQTRAVRLVLVIADAKSLYQKPVNPVRFFAELKRRDVCKVVFA